jgi:FkbM family methyltransferase
MASRERGGFWVQNNRALKHITLLLPRIFSEVLLLGRSHNANATRPVMVDLGAGMYGKENSVDDSDSLALLAGFKSQVDVFAFEARPDKAEDLRIEALRRNSTALYSDRLHVHAMGAADVAGRLHFANCGGSTNWMVVKSVAELARGCQIKYEVPVSSIDEMERAGILKDRRLAYVKVDVEGSEVAVAKGMSNVLSRQAVDLMSFEYAKNWNVPMFYDAQRGQGRRLTLDQMKSLYNDSSQMERTLESFQQRMSAYGYDTYLLHGGPAEAGVKLMHDDGPHNTPWRATLVPVYGPFFERQNFEICLRRHHFKQLWCWNDLLVVRRSNHALKRRLFRLLHASQPRQPFQQCDTRCL